MRPCPSLDSADDLRSLASADPTTEVLDVHGDGRDDYQSPRAGCNISGLYDCDSTTTSSIYFRHTDAPGALQYYDYWFLYRYNDYPVFLLEDANHEADWERVLLAVPDGSPSTFSWAALSGHGPAWRYLRGVLSCNGGVAGPSMTCGSEGAPDGQRVNVFVAEGSHANYPVACETGCDRPDESSAYNFLDERDYDGESYWGNNDEPTGLIEMPSAQRPTLWDSSPPDSAATWVDWPGMWGEELDVKSPGNQGQFFAPWLADACTGKWTTYTCPSADFTYFPTSPVVDEEVVLNSLTQGTPTSYAWDLDGDNVYDDAFGEDASVTFSSAGDADVGLRVEDANGFHHLKRATIYVYGAQRAGSSQGLSVTSNATSEEAPIGCGPWAGPAVQLVACDPETLDDSVTTGALDTPVDWDGLPEGSMTAEFPGLMQSVGPGLTPNRRVKLPASARGKLLEVRARDRGRLVHSVFRASHTQASTAITTGRAKDGFPLIRLLRPDGRQIAPFASTRSGR